MATKSKKKTNTAAVRIPLKKGREWLDEKHSVWSANIDEWIKNERRLEGGEDVAQELRRFDWEISTDPDEGYQLRQSRATYVNFPEMFCDTISGHLLENVGDINFGGMGEVARKTDQADPSRAEQVYYNVDGVGNDGSQLKAYIAAAWKRAAATGHRWHYIEMPRTPPGTREGELEGQRPYIIEYSPIRVTNWEEDAGTLLWAIIRVPTGRQKIEGGVFVKGGLGYMLVIKKGIDTFDGDDVRFKAGGQFFFAEDGSDLTDMDTNFDKVGKGEPPLFRLYAERSKGNTERAKISRCVTTDLGNVAVSYMDLSSAADYNVWNGADGKAFIAGASQGSYNLAMEMFEDGSQFAPLEGVVNSSGNMAPVSVIFNSAGVVPAAAFKARLEHKLEEARWLAAREAIGEPGSSGVSKIAGFGEAVKPRLVMFASELETWLNILLYFFELRFAVIPSASANWVKEFDLLSLIDKIERQFNLEKLSGLRSPTLGAKAMVSAGEDSGLITDDAEGEKIKQEYLAAGTLKVETEKAAADMMKASGVDPEDKPGKPPVPVPPKKKAGPELVE